MWYCDPRDYSECLFDNGLKFCASHPGPNCHRVWFEQGGVSLKLPIMEECWDYEHECWVVRCMEDVNRLALFAYNVRI